jgi:hypothetical protein
MATRKTITKAQAVRYRHGSRAVKSEILDVVRAVTGYHRDYARRALRMALTPREVKARARRPGKYDAEVVAAVESQLKPPCEAHGQTQSPRCRRPLHPRHRLAPTRQRHQALPRFWPRVLQQPDPARTPQDQPHPPTRSTRLHRSLSPPQPQISTASVHFPIRQRGHRNNLSPSPGRWSVNRKQPRKEAMDRSGCPRYRASTSYGGLLCWRSIPYLAHYWDSGPFASLRHGPLEVHARKP